ncbi:hypothetical protein AAKU67_002385 [Oxalobacteraceae bacterium GrIS 2.11]
MDITIAHPDFKTQLLEIRISGYFHSPAILLNGAAIKRVGGVYTVLNDAGHDVVVELNSSFFYRLPQLLIEHEATRITGTTGWSQYAGWKKTWLAQLLKSSLFMVTPVNRFNKSS